MLEYYRKKIGEYDIEREEILKRLDKFKGALDDQVRIKIKKKHKNKRRNLDFSSLKFSINYNGNCDKKMTK